ncbi:MAG: leucine-rich repeat domain-containing protein [Limisphaerales bacterium]
MSNLQELDLTDSEVSDDGVKAIGQALPKCKIQWPAK